MVALRTEIFLIDGDFQKSLTKCLPLISQSTSSLSSMWCCSSRPSGAGLNIGAWVQLRYMAQRLQYCLDSGLRTLG